MGDAPDQGSSQHKHARRPRAKLAVISDLRLGRSEVLRSLRHHQRAQSQGHYTIDLLEERGVEKGMARRSSLKIRESVTVNRTKEKLEKLLRDWAERIWTFPSAANYILS